MAALAFCILAALVHVVEFMACHAFFCDFCLEAAFVATAASGIFMFTGEGKFCVTVMVEINFSPFVGAMAGLALIAIVSMMLVICLVTTDTGLCNFYLVRILGVTGYAADLFVAAE